MPRVVFSNRATPSGASSSREERWIANYEMPISRATREKLFAVPAATKEGPQLGRHQQGREFGRTAPTANASDPEGLAQVGLNHAKRDPNPICIALAGIGGPHSGSNPFDDLNATCILQACEGLGHRRMG